MKPHILNQRNAQLIQNFVRMEYEDARIVYNNRDDIFYVYTKLTKDIFKIRTMFEDAMPEIFELHKNEHRIKIYESI